MDRPRHTLHLGFLTLGRGRCRLIHHLVVLRLLLQVQYQLRATLLPEELFVRRLFDCEGATLRCPPPRPLVCSSILEAARYDLDLLGNEENRIETHSKLADEAHVALALVELFHEVR